MEGGLERRCLEETGQQQTRALREASVCTRGAECERAGGARLTLVLKDCAPADWRCIAYMLFSSLSCFVSDPSTSRSRK